MVWPGVAALVTLAVIGSTLQTGINGSVHAYATDVGEIQNALPRWGIIHHSGYPQYSAIGSLFVTALRPIGIEPAASASLFSALWGACAAGLIVVLAQELGAPGPAALLGALAATLSTSVWVFASLAEVHTMTLVLSLATLIFALRFGRFGERRDLVLLALFFSQGVVHQRSVVFLAPAVLVLVWPQLRALVAGPGASPGAALWRHLGPAIGVSLLSALTYLYLPFRAWTGATWVYGSPGTWQGFREAVLFDLPGQTVSLGSSSEAWWKRIQVLANILSDDMFWPLLVLGLAGLMAVWTPARGARKGAWRERFGLTLAWLPSLALSLMIWRGRVIDAQLAAKLPIMLMAGLGLAMLLTWAWQRSRAAGVAAAVALALVLAAWGWKTRPFVLSITRDSSAEAVIATAAQVAPPPDGRPTTLVSTWGLDYWALAYAQECRHELPGLNLVDHNADLRAIVERGDRLLILTKILHVFPVSRWEKRLGRLYLCSAAPGIVEISPAPPVAPADVPPTEAVDLENGLAIRSAAVEWAGDTAGDTDRLLVTVYWESIRPVDEDYSVAVHLLARDPPASPADILAQADSVHPVDGWYPTSRWSLGEIVRDAHLVPVSEESAPVAVRIALYRSDPQAGFVNSPWLSLPVPAR